MVELSFLANIDEAELLCNKNRAFDHLRDFSICSERIVSSLILLMLICLRVSGEWDWIWIWYSLVSSPESLVISASFHFFFVVASSIRCPRITALWAVHRKAGEVCVVLLIRKYSSKWSETLVTNSGSERSESLRRQVAFVGEMPIYEIDNSTML